MRPARARLERVPNRLAEQQSPNQARGLRRAAELGKGWLGSDSRAEDNKVVEAVGVVEASVT